MSTKVYLTMPCDIQKKDIPISYEVIYFDKKPKIGQVRCEKNPIFCNMCPMKQRIRDYAVEHLNQVYLKEFKK